MAVEAASLQVLSVAEVLSAGAYILGVAAIIFTGLLTAIYNATVRRLDRIEQNAKRDMEHLSSLMEGRLSSIDGDIRELKKELNSLWRESSRLAPRQITQGND